MTRTTCTANINSETIDELPAVITPKQYAQLFGYSLRYVQKLCQRGKVRCSNVNGHYYIDTAAALKAFGLDANGGER